MRPKTNIATMPAMIAAFTVHPFLNLPCDDCCARLVQCEVAGVAGYASPAVRSQPETEGRPMAYGLTFRLELEDGTPADPPTFRSAPGVSWKAGDTIAIGRRTLRVLGVRDDDADQPPALVVEDMSGNGH